MLLTMKPLGTPKLLVTRKHTEVNTLEAIVNNGKYLCITAEEFDVYDEGKVPEAFISGSMNRIGGRPVVESTQFV
jgi:hypothetical protein